MDSSMQEIIERAREQTLSETPEERAAQERLQEFCDLLGEIEQRPDAEARLAEIETVMKAIASNDDEETEAAQKLGEAFAVIEEYAGYLPANIYRQFSDGISDWVHDSDWMSDPVLCRQILPLLIAKAIRIEEAKGA